uniref:Anti_prolifrtn domain-containing protein n=1 Tax=Strongyloides papillosus TaxID=174720 RepID=A0A0N5BNZ7_STREA
MSADTSTDPFTSRKEYLYKSLDDLLNSMLEFSEETFKCEWEEKDTEPYTVENSRNKHYLNDCTAVRLTGYVNFGQNVQPGLSMMGSEAGEGYSVGKRVTLTFSRFPSSDENGY